MRHVRVQHSHKPNFRVTCNIDGCQQTYNKFNSYYRHVVRTHDNMLDSAGPDNPSGGIDPNRDDVDRLDIRLNISEIQEDSTEDGLQLDFHNNDVEDGHNGIEVQADGKTLKEFSELERKHMAVDYIMNLKEFHKIRETSVEFITCATETFVQRSTDALKTDVFKVLEHAGINPHQVSGLEECFLDINLPFDGLRTTHLRNSFIKQNNLYVEPLVVRLGHRIRNKRKRGQITLDLVNDSFIYLPIVKSLEQFLQNKDILDIVTTRPLFAEDGIYENIYNGSIYRQHPLSQTNNCDINLQLLLYFDDFEVCNPLGKQAGIHKVGILYYNIVNLTPVYRSRLPSIRLVAVIKRENIDHYSINKVLEKIKDDLVLLDTGTEIQIKDTNHIIKGSLLAFCGDTLASNEFGGFKVGVGFAYQKCRECQCTFEDMQQNFEEKDFISRSKQNYDHQCTEIEKACTLGLRETLSMAYGINARSTASNFPHFDVTKMNPMDVMHVVYEGAAMYELKLSLCSLIEGGHMSLTQLNNQIENFPYGYKHRSSKPSKIPRKMVDSPESSLNQSASSMLLLILLMPFILIDKLRLDVNNEIVKFITEITEIVNIIRSHVISDETLLMLKTLISEHLRTFKELFPSKNIIPKQHFMLHIPSTIKRYGPACMFLA